LHSVSSLSDHSPLNGPYTMPVAANPPPVLLTPIAGPRSTPPPVRGRRPAAANAAAHSSTVTNLSLCERGGDHRSADRADAITEAADLPSTTSTRMPLLRAKLWQRDGSRQAGRQALDGARLIRGSAGEGFGRTARLVRTHHACVPCSTHLRTCSAATIASA
jgi:hypothetical protein